MRLLEGRDDARRGAGGQARSDLPQARPASRACACSISAAAGAASCKFAAERYGVHGTGITVSQGAGGARATRTRRRPADRDPSWSTTRALEGSSTASISIGMFEHVGAKNYTRLHERSRERCSTTTACSSSTPSAATGSPSTAIRGSTSTSSPTAMLPPVAQIGAACRAGASSSRTGTTSAPTTTGR